MRPPRLVAALAAAFAFAVPAAAALIFAGLRKGFQLKVSPFLGKCTPIDAGII